MSGIVSDGPGSYIKGAPGGSQPIHTQINIDGRKVAESVTQHQSKAANRPQTGTTSFDGRRSLTPAGATGSW